MIDFIKSRLGVLIIIGSIYAFIVAILCFVPLPSEITPHIVTHWLMFCALLAYLITAYVVLDIPFEMIGQELCPEQQRGFKILIRVGLISFGIAILYCFLIFTIYLEFKYNIFCIKFEDNISTVVSASRWILFSIKILLIIGGIFVSQADCLLGLGSISNMIDKPFTVTLGIIAICYLIFSYIIVSHHFFVGVISGAASFQVIATALAIPPRSYSEANLKRIKKQGITNK